MARFMRVASVTLGDSFVSAGSRKVGSVSREIRGEQQRDLGVPVSTTCLKMAESSNLLPFHATNSSCSCGVDVSSVRRAKKKVGGTNLARKILLKVLHLVLVELPLRLPPLHVGHGALDVESDGEERPAFLEHRELGGATQSAKSALCLEGLHKLGDAPSP